MIQEYRLVLVLEAYKMSKEDIDKVFQVWTADELAKKDKAIKDSINLYFTLEDPDELISDLRMSKAFPSLDVKA